MSLIPGKTIPVRQMADILQVNWPENRLVSMKTHCSTSQWNKRPKVPEGDFWNKQKRSYLQK